MNNQCVKCKHFMLFESDAAGDGTTNDSQGMCMNRDSDANYIFGYRGNESITSLCELYHIVIRKGMLLSKAKTKR